MLGEILLLKYEKQKFLGSIDCLNVRFIAWTVLTLLKPSIKLILDLVSGIFIAQIFKYILECFLEILWYFVKFSTCKHLTLQFIFSEKAKKLPKKKCPFRFAISNLSGILRKSQLYVVHKKSETKSFLSILCFWHFRSKIYGFWNEENWQNILCTVIAALHLFSNPDCNPIHIYFDLVGYQVYLRYLKALKSFHIRI